MFYNQIYFLTIIWGRYHIEGCIINTIWTPAEHQLTGEWYNNVEVYISFLRKKLNHIGSKTAIKTIRGVGYRLEE